MSQKIVNITLKLNDKVTKPLRNVQKSFDDLVDKKLGWTKTVSQSFKNLSKASGFGKISSAAKGLGSDLGNVGTEALKFGGTVLAGTGLAIGGLLALVKQTADAGDGLINVAKRLDFGIEAFQEYQYAAEQSGVSSEDFTKGLETFTRKVGEAKNGQGQLYTFLKKSNPELLKQVLGAKSNEEAFTMMVNSLGGVKDAQKQAAYSAMLFGKSGKNFTNLANEGSGGIDKLRESARSLGIMTEAQAVAADNFGDKWSSIERVFTGIRNTIGSALIPELDKLADTFMAMVKENQPQIQAFAKSFAENLPEAIEKLKSAFNGLMAAVGVIIDVFTWLGETFGYSNTIIAILIAVFGTGLVGALAAATLSIYSLGVAILTTPLGWIILGVMAVIAVVVLLYKYWGDIWGGIKSITSTVIDWIMMAFDKVVSKFSALRGMLPSWLGGKTSAEVNVNNPDSMGNKAVQNFNQAQTSKNEDVIKVSFDNLPKGARVDSAGSKKVETDIRMGLMATSTI